MITSKPTGPAAISPERNRQALTDDLFSRFVARVTANPQEHQHYFAVVVLAKT
jgi:hypothetical protein